MKQAIKFGLSLLLFLLLPEELGKDLKSSPHPSKLTLWRQYGKDTV